MCDPVSKKVFGFGDPPKPPPPPPEPPNYVDRDVQAAGDRERKRQRAAAGRSGTILTGPQGATEGAPVGKTVLGG